MEFSMREHEVFRSARVASTSRERGALEKLRTHPSEGVRAALLCNHAFGYGASAHARVLLADPRATWVTWQAVAASPYLDPELYECVYDDSKWYVLIALANNPKCPRHLLERIALCGDPRNKDVAQVARNRLLSNRPS